MYYPKIIRTLGIIFGYTGYSLLISKTIRNHISCWVPSVMFFCSAENLLVGGPWRMFCSGFHRWKLWSAVQCGLSPAVAVGWPGLQCPTAQRCPGLAPPRPAVHHHCGLAHHSPAASVSRPGASGEVIHRRKHQVSIYSTHK